MPHTGRKKYLRNIRRFVSTKYGKVSNKNIQICEYADTSQGPPYWPTSVREGYN